MCFASVSEMEWDDCLYTNYYDLESDRNCCCEEGYGVGEGCGMVNWIEGGMAGAYLRQRCLEDESP